eukprot:1147417-Pelagomonas_calceolata.AAC.4
MGPMGHRAATGCARHSPGGFLHTLNVQNIVPYVNNRFASMKSAEVFKWFHLILTWLYLRNAWTLPGPNYQRMQSIMPS